MTDVVTSIIPQAYNGHRLPSSETVDSQIVSNYPIIYKRVIKYEDIKLKEDATDEDAENGTMICSNANELYAALRNRAKHEFESGIDMPNITYDIDMIDLSRTDLYSEYKHLLTVNLGDTVHVKHRRLNIVTTARVIELVYDCITEKVVSLVLGDYKKNYFNDVSSVVNSAKEVIDTSNGSLMADKIKGIINLMNTSLRAQKDIAERQDVRAILFEDLDSSSPTFGAMCIGTQGIQISKKRNESNSDWIWGTAIDFKSIYAEHIITGVLSDQKGNNHWNLETGELTTKNMTAENGTFSGKLESPTINGGSIKGSTITGGSITSNTNINVNTDLRVGNNMYIGSYADRDTKKYIYLNDRFAIASRNSILAFGVENGDLYKGKLYVTSSGGVTMNSGIAQVTVGSQDASIFCNSTCHITVGKNNIEINPNNDLIVRSNLILDNVRFISGRTTSGSSVGMLVRGDDNNVYVGYYNNGTIIRGSFCKLGSASGATITSDKNLKRDIFDMSKKYENFFMGLKPVSYKYCTNNHKRDHVGFIAQDVESAMNNAGLNSEQFAGLCIDEVKNYEVLTEDDDMKYLANKGISKIYSLRYEEFIALNTHMIQNLYKMVDKQNKEIEKLKEEIRCLSLEEKD